GRRGAGARVSTATKLGAAVADRAPLGGPCLPARPFDKSAEPPCGSPWEQEPPTRPRYRRCDTSRHNPYTASSCPCAPTGFLRGSSSWDSESSGSPVWPVRPVYSRHRESAWPPPTQPPPHGPPRCPDRVEGTSSRRHRAERYPSPALPQHLRRVGSDLPFLL